jgi:protein-tyrosine phosphatase
VRVDRHVGFERLRNFRDLGGYRVPDGRTVRWGRLYRSDSLAKLAGEDLRRFADLGVRTVVDLRYPWEARQHGRVPESTGVDYHNLSIEHRPYDQASPAEDVSPVDYLAPRYAEVAEDGVVELRQVLEVVAAAATAPVVVHCASGKDRTGIVAALVLALLGVSERDIVADFALTGLATGGLARRVPRSHAALARLRPGARGTDAAFPGRTRRRVRLGARLRAGPARCRRRGRRGPA